MLKEVWLRHGFTDIVLLDKLAVDCNFADQKHNLGWVSQLDSIIK